MKKKQFFLPFAPNRRILGFFEQVVIVQDLDKPRCAGAFWGEVTVRVINSHKKEARVEQKSRKMDILVFGR